MQPYYQDAKGMTIYHGRAEDVLQGLGERPALIVTSPPYNLKRGGWGTGPKSIHTRAAVKFDDEWYPDEIPEPEYQAQQRAILETCLKVCDGAVCYNHKVRYAISRAGRVIHPMEWLAGLPLWVEIVWDRGGGMALNSRRPVVSDERIFVLGRPKAWNNESLTTVWRISVPEHDIDHPCPFPNEIPARLIRMFTEPGDLVLDPYMGSGTTLREAKRLGRRAIGIDCNEQFCQLAAASLEPQMRAAIQAYENDYTGTLFA